jgi:RNA polymerase sigma-70 factor (ECF subfamily)
VLSFFQQFRIWRDMTHRATAAEFPRWDWASVLGVCLRETRRVLGASAQADDAAQEAALRVWRQRSSCRTPECPGGWIAVIARREALRAAAKPHHAPLEAIPDPVDERPAVAEAVMQKVDVARVLSVLEDSDRRLLVGRYWQDLSYGELAHALDMPEATVGVRLHRLRLRLRENMVKL